MRFTDRQISVEAAKLLGLPFAWRGEKFVLMFVRTAEGLELWSRQEDTVWTSIFTGPQVETVLDGNNGTFYVVEFPEDDEEGTDADHG